MGILFTPNFITIDFNYIVWSTLNEIILITFNGDFSPTYEGGLLGNVPQN